MLVELIVYDESGTKPQTVILNPEKIDYFAFSNGRFKIILNGKDTGFHIHSMDLNFIFKVVDGKTGKLKK